MVSIIHALYRNVNIIMVNKIIEIDTAKADKKLCGPLIINANNNNVQTLWSQYDNYYHDIVNVYNYNWRDDCGMYLFLVMPLNEKNIPPIKKTFITHATVDSTL